jgi:hypothetical protein
MKQYITKILCSMVLCEKTLTLLSASCAPNTIPTYDNIVRRYFDFFDEHRLAPPFATPAHMARYVAWLGQLGSIKASSQQLYMPAVNGFFKDHGLEVVALGDLVAKVRKGLAPSQVAIEDTPTRVHMPTSIVVQALRMTQALRYPYASRSLTQQRVRRFKPTSTRTSTTPSGLYGSGDLVLVLLSRRIRYRLPNRGPHRLGTSCAHVLRFILTQNF